MPICTGGSEPKDGVPTTVALVGEGIAALIALRFPWLGMVAGFVSPMLINLDDLCSVDPPTVPTWTADDIIALLAPGFTPATIAATNKLTDTILNVAWYQFCECSAMATPAEPSPASSPSDLPVVNPFPTEPTVGPSTYVGEIMSDSPVQYWRFAESGGSLAHSIAGSPKVPWVIESARPLPFSHSGPVSDGGAAMTSNSQFTMFGIETFANSPWTVEFWIWPALRWTSGSSSTGLIRLGFGSQLDVYWGSAGLQVVLNPGAQSTFITMASFEWHHIVITKSGTTCTVYVDGVSAGSFTSASGGVLVGAPGSITGGSGVAIAEVAVYGAVLSGTRISAHYAAADRKAYRPAWKGGSIAQPGGLSDAASALEQIRDLVTLIQRQEVPFGFIDGTAHSGLTGSAQLTVSGLLGIRVDLTTIPAYVGRIDGQPIVYFDVGYVSLGTTAGFQRRELLRHDPQYVFSGEAGLYTRVAYTFPPGVVATITELLREP